MKTRVGIHDRTDEPVAADEASKYRQVMAALDHPDCPVDLFEFDKQKLSRHISIRLSRKYMRANVSVQ